MNTPIIFTWNGEAMEPLPRCMKACDEKYVIGGRYELTNPKARSKASHDHFFACVADAWANLPDTELARFPSPEHLRKVALISSGYANSRQFVASSKAEALRLASFIRKPDDYSIITVHECVVTEYTAQSQSIKAMGHERFQDSKNRVLAFAANLIGVTPDELSKNAATVA